VERSWSMACHIPSRSMPKVPGVRELLMMISCRGSSDARTIYLAA
jgi:hypothetical protein